MRRDSISGSAVWHSACPRDCVQVLAASERKRRIRDHKEEAQQNQSDAKQKVRYAVVGLGYIAQAAIYPKGENALRLLVQGRSNIGGIVMSSTSRRRMRAAALVLTLCALVFSISLAVTLAVAANDKPGPARRSEPAGSPGAGQSATLTASLVDPVNNAKEKTATVKVEVTGVKLIDPALTNKKPTKGQGHLHYRVDDGPVIATTTTKLSFHELTPGKHKIVVMLANNDHSPTGLEQTLEVTVP